MTGQRKTLPPTVDDPAFLTALVTEHFVLQTARWSGTGEATGRAGLYVATLSSGLVATGSPAASRTSRCSSAPC